jgi:hypothetical protein
MYIRRGRVEPGVVGVAHHADDGAPVPVERSESEKVAGPGDLAVDRLAGEGMSASAWLMIATRRPLPVGGELPPLSSGMPAA